MSDVSDSAIKGLDEAGSPAFITCEGGDQPAVVCKFKTTRQAQEFHQALIDCGNAARILNDGECGKSKERIQGHLDTIVANYEPGGTYRGVALEEFTKEELLAIINAMGESQERDRSRYLADLAALGGVRYE